MSFLQVISLLQREATGIKPPAGTDRLPTIGGLPGPAFFPEGFGLTDAARERDKLPSIMAVGHNFGCAQYRDMLQMVGREDDKATWRNLDSLIVRAGASPNDCFRTNWFVGLLPGMKQTGTFLKKDDDEYEDACLSLLKKQIPRGRIDGLKDFVRGMGANARTLETKNVVARILEEVDRLVEPPPPPIRACSH